MKVTTLRGAPSLRNHLNQGGTFNDWRHTMTTYNKVTVMANRVDGCRFGRNYQEMVERFAAEAIAGLRNPDHIAIVTEWRDEKRAEYL